MSSNAVVQEQGYKARNSYGISIDGAITLVIIGAVGGVFLLCLGLVSHQSLNMWRFGGLGVAVLTIWWGFMSEFLVREARRSSQERGSGVILGLFLLIGFLAGAVVIGGWDLLGYPLLAIQCSLIFAICVYQMGRMASGFK